MINADSCFLDGINSLVRRVKGRVELYEGSTLLDTFNATDRLKSFTIERTPDENKIFGYGICQKLQVKLRDHERNININKSHTLEAVFGTNCDYIYTNPVFYVTEISRDENSNELTVTAYDALHNASAYTFADLNLQPPYSIGVVAATAAAFLGLPFRVQGGADASFDTIYPEGANFSGGESLRDVLNSIAEATQTIYFIDHNWNLTFKRLDVSGAPVVTIDKSKYFTLKTNEPFTVSAVCSTTELGNNVIAGDESNVVCYIRDNPFWDIRDDIDSLVINALAAVRGLTLTQFNCSWRGNYLVEIGDKIGIETKEGTVITTYLLDDKLTYNGAMSETSEWAYSNNKSETQANPATITDVLKVTSAKVDRANQKIELIVQSGDENNATLSELRVDINGIYGEVSRVEQLVNENNETVEGEIATLTQKVSTAITPEALTIEIEKAMEAGTTKVETSTGFTFNETGLTVSKTGSEMTTTITEDGMTVYRDDQEVLTADNTGVKAENLHATTYLMIGKNSRFEDYENNRTGCFWIGG